MFGATVRALKHWHSVHAAPLEKQQIEASRKVLDEEYRSRTGPVQTPKRGAYSLEMVQKKWNLAFITGHVQSMEGTICANWTRDPGCGLLQSYQASRNPVRSVQLLDTQHCFSLDL